MKLRLLKPWRPSKSEWDLAAAHHLLLRAGFGAASGEAQGLVKLGFAPALEQVLTKDAHEPRLFEGARQVLSGGQIERLGAWWMSLILGAGAPLRERITLMWHDHFATSMTKVQDQRRMHEQLQLFRSAGMGDFRQLLQAVARDPAMLRWLDGDENRAGHPNENFAREVMELFALGIGNYDEGDVREAARAFTGWRESPSGFKLRQVDHDAGTKTILGQTGKWGSEEAIDILLAAPACARHIARRLLEEFVHPAPQDSWIEETAQLLVHNEWHIEKTVHVLLSSTLFFAEENRRTRIAGPVELMVMSIRGLGLQASPKQLYMRCGEMGQRLFHPKSVKGWDGMRRWINAGTWIARHNALLELCQANRERIQAQPEQLLERLLPALCKGDLAERLELALGKHPKLRQEASQVAALILTSPEFHLV